MYLQNFTGIPHQLAHGRFIKLTRRDKIPIEKSYKITKNYAADDPDLLEHIKCAGNYGVLSRNDICVIDIDDGDAFRATGIQLPESFTVRRGNSKRGHYYFSCPDCPKDYRDKHLLSFGDVRLGNDWYTCGPGCKHPSGEFYEIHTDLPFAILPFETVKDIIVTHGKLKKKSTSVPTRTYVAGDSWSDMLGMRCEDILYPNHAVVKGDAIIGAHPLPGHTNQGGKCYQISISKNVWTCWQHGSGGGPMELFAVVNGIIECEDAGPGCLKGHGAELIALLKSEGYDLSAIESPIFQRREETRKILESLGVL